MRTNRPYRDALGVDVALAELLSNAGKQFDPRVVDTFVRMVVPTAEPGAVDFLSQAPASSITTSGACMFEPNGLPQTPVSAARTASQHPAPRPPRPPSGERLYLC